MAANASNSSSTPVIRTCWANTQTSHKAAPWYVVRSDDKKRARLNGIRHILSMIPYKRIKRDKIKLPKRSSKDRYNDEIDLKKAKLVKEVY